MVVGRGDTSAQREARSSGRLPAAVGGDVERDARQLWRFVAHALERKDVRLLVQDLVEHIESGLCYAAGDALKSIDRNC